MKPCMIISFKIGALAMSHYNESKKARRIAAVVYLLIMAVILTGTYLSNQQKAAEKEAQNKTLAP